MKRILALILCTPLLTGCSSLLPKTVEFFQKKVQPVPTMPASAQETQKEAAQVVVEKVTAAKEQALVENVPTNVYNPIVEGTVVAAALAESLGPPLSHWSGTPSELSTKLLTDKAKVDKAVASYTVATQTVVGKKIEGTGWFQIGYFSYIAIILAGLALLWVGIKIWGLFNPVIGTAAGAVGRASQSVLTKGFSELVSGGQQFIKWVDTSTLPADTKDWIVNTFKVAHQTAQSVGTQDTVDRLTVPLASKTEAVNPAPIAAAAAMPQAVVVPTVVPQPVATILNPAATQ